MLVALVGDVCAAAVRPVGPDHSGLEAISKPQGAVKPARPDGGCQAVRDTVGQLQRMLIVSKREHRQDWSEDFLLSDAHVGKNAAEDGRLEEVAG
jgi:hypothetical protein